MGEDSTHAERSSNCSSNPASPQQQENVELLIPSFNPSSAPSSPTSTLSRMGLKSPTSPTMDRSQVSAITVTALLDKLVNMLDAVQDNQRRMEQRQTDLEGAVRGVQGDVTRLSKSQTSTSNSVSKLLERSRKVTLHLKEVRERMDKQSAQVKRLEANHNHLLKRNHFKVLIFQEDNEIPSSVFVKDSMKSPHPSYLEEEGSHATPSIAGSMDANCNQDEALQTISLSSDEDADAMGLHEEDEILAGEGALGLGAPRFAERSRADKLKRSSLKKVDSLKKAFSRQSIEKKMTKISTKIVPPERREKIKKSFTPNHPKSPTAKSSSFKVSPMTFNVKKIRDGEVPVKDGASPGEMAHVEIPPLGSLDGDHPLAEVYPQGDLPEGGEAMPSPSSSESVTVELVVNGGAGSPGYDDLKGDHAAGLSALEHGGEDEAEAEDVEEEDQQEALLEAAAARLPAAVVTVKPLLRS
ncbi:caveolae-associated protein 2a [Aplochiton taeniatus]